ncbi:MAG: hypothetical protein IK025_08845 [Bacteroidales bacterium]|nr:hypothetical protein [Bacteroidales bacterium]
MDNYLYNTKKQPVIPQVITITRYGTGSVILLNCAESPTETIPDGDSVQANSHDMYLSRFVQLYGMTDRDNKTFEH